MVPLEIYQWQDELAGASADINDTDDGLTAPHILELSEADAWAQIISSIEPVLTEQYGFRIERVGSSLLILAPALERILFNRVIGFGLDSFTAEENLQQIIHAYRRAGVRRFALQLNPADLTGDLRRQLTELGFTHRGNWMKVWCRPSNLPATSSAEIRVEEITVEKASIFGDVAGAGFGEPLELHPVFSATIGRPGWHYYLAYIDDEPVAGGVLYVRDRIGWIGVGSTVPAFRGKGAQSALIAHRLGQAAAQSCRLVVSETAEDLPEQPSSSYRNMIRAGMQPAYRRANYVLELGGS